MSAKIADMPAFVQNVFFLSHLFHHVFERLLGGVHSVVGWGEVGAVAAPKEDPGSTAASIHGGWSDLLN